MTLDDIANALPNGLHDARLNSVLVDYVRREAVLVLDLWVGTPGVGTEEKGEARQRAEIRLSDLLFWIAEGPDEVYRGPHAASMIDVGSLAGFEGPLPKHPPIPGDAFGNWIFVSNWNDFIYLAARNASVVLGEIIGHISTTSCCHVPSPG